MLSISIKNFILVVLIILIVHFIIKNHMIEKYDQSIDIKYKFDPTKMKIPNFDPVQEEMPSNNTQTIVKNIDKSLPEIISKPIITERFDKNEHIKEKNEKLDELYNFVFKKEGDSLLSESSKMGLKNIEVKEFNTDQIIDKDEMFNGIHGYTHSDTFSSY